MLPLSTEFRQPKSAEKGYNTRLDPILWAKPLQMLDR